MKALVLKDIYILLHDLRKLLLSLIITTIIYVIMLYTTVDNDAMSAFILTAIPAFLGIFMSISAFAHDEKSDWMQYSLTTPVSRRQYLCGKYISHFIFSGFGFLAGVLLILLASLVTGTMGMEQCIAIGAAALIVIVCFSTLTVPIFIRFGTAAGSIISITACFSLIILGTVYMFLLIEKLMGSRAFPAAFFILIPVLFLVISVLLHCLGFRWITKKEF